MPAEYMDELATDLLSHIEARHKEETRRKYGFPTSELGNFYRTAQRKRFARLMHEILSLAPEETMLLGMKVQERVDSGSRQQKKVMRLLIRISVLRLRKAA